MRVAFFRVAERKSPKKGRPYCLRPLRCATGQPGVLGHGVRRRTHCALTRSVQTTAASQFTKRVCPSAHAPPRALRAPGAYRREPANRTSTRAIAALGPACAARGACAREMGPSAAKARAAAWLFGCWMFDCPTPCWLRLRRGGCGVSMGVEAPMPCELTRRGCPSGAPQAQSEFHGAPRNRPAAGLPLRNAKGSQTGGRLSFGYFSLAKQRTSTSPAGASPGSRPEHWHAVATESPAFSKRRPNAPGKTQ